MGPVQGHQCPYDAPSVAEHFRKTGTVNLNPADVLLFRDSLELGEFDGICAVSKNNQTPVVDRAELPFIMTWTSNSEAAKERKMQTIRTLWIEAVDQIPGVTPVQWTVGVSTC